MTKRLYYTDSYLAEFSASVLDQRQVDKSPAVILDQTAFYPESGGQPHDKGFLGDVRVLKVVEDDAGSILHILEQEIHAGTVAGRIDWPRRFDHMQQHTGQHLLSQAFLATAKAPTLSFHLGQESSTIDIEMAHPSAEKMEEAQTLACGIVFQNRPVHILTTDRQSLNALGVRKESDREGEIRVIDVDGFDRSACGGTHVRNTGEIGLICIINFERYKGGVRVEFAAGGRALRFFQKDNGLLKKLARIYSASPESIPEITEKMLQEKTALARENDDLRSQLLELEAADLIKEAVKTPYASTICRIYSGRSLESLKTLAQKLTALPNTLAILAVSEACQVVVARSKDLQGSCNDAVKRTIAGLGGKGGGRPELAQAGGVPADSMKAWLQSLENYFLSLGS
jgi:alanyl-tRNA synthetase